MFKRVVFSVVLTAAAISLLVAPVLAQEEMSPEEYGQAMMEALMKYGTPGEPHQGFAEMTGTWDCTVLMWVAPGMPPDTSIGVAEISMILDGRYMKQDYVGQFGPEEFHGLSLTGYDRFREEYFTIWLDDMSTGMSVMWGEATDSTHTTIRFDGTIDDIVSGTRDKPYRQYLKLESADTFIMEMAAIDDRGNETQNMKIIYNRRK